MPVSSASLKVAELDLAAARSHVQQFKEISQANEEALASLNATYDGYKSTTEAQLTASWVILTLRESILTTTKLFLSGPTRIPSNDSEEC
jgi:nucleoprotein TPR